MIRIAGRNVGETHSLAQMQSRGSVAPPKSAQQPPTIILARVIFTLRVTRRLTNANFLMASLKDTTACIRHCQEVDDWIGIAKSGI